MDEQPAASSAADTTPAPSPSDALANASPEGYAAWQRDGELPATETSTPAPVAPADSTPAEPASQAASTDAIPKAAPEPADKTKTEQRFQELLADRARERERADRLTREIAALRTPPPPVDARPAASSPAPANDPRPNKDDSAKYPEGQFGEQFMEDLWDWKQRQANTRAEQAQRAQQVKAQSQAFQSTWLQRMAAAKAKYPDFNEEQADRLIPPGSPIDDWIRTSDEAGDEVANYFVTHPAEVGRVLALPSQRAFSLAMTSLEATLKPAQPKTVSDAPDPARTLGERSTSPIDAVARAVATKDVAAFLAAENARELALFRTSGTR